MPIFPTAPTFKAHLAFSSAATANIAKLYPMHRLRGGSWRNARRVSTMRVRASAADRTNVAIDFVDFYELFALDPSASKQEVKAAYRYLQKRCHPDVYGPNGHTLASLLNEAYSNLEDPEKRKSFDEERAFQHQRFSSGFSGAALSTWNGSPEETSAFVVDEAACVGCLQCALLAPNTFAIETSQGKARVKSQWADARADVRDAVAACPVECIHKVPRAHLPLLEHVARNFSMEATWRGRRRAGLFAEAAEFERQQSRAAEAARARTSAPETSHSRSHAARAIFQASRPKNAQGQLALARDARQASSAFLHAPPQASAPSDVERLKELAARCLGQSASPAGEAGEVAEYMRIPSRKLLSEEQMAAAAEAAQRALQERRATRQRKAAAFSSGGGTHAAVAAAAMFVMTVLFNPAVEYHLSAGNGLEGDKETISLDERVKLAQDRQNRTEACHQSGGGVCRFFL